MRSSERRFAEPMKSKSDTTSKCPTCGGSGWVIELMSMKNYINQNHLEHIYQDEDFETRVSRKCPSCHGGFAGRVDTARKTAGIPTSFYDKRLSEFDWSLYVKEDGTIADTSLHQNAVRSFVDGFEEWEQKNMGLYIYSKAKGSGKSFLASCICNELMSTRAIRTRFVNAADLIDIIQSADKDSPEEYKRNPLKLLQECVFLVVDDLGQRTNSDWLEDILYKLFDERMRNGKLTVVTSNLSIDSLPYDDRIADRLAAMCLPLHLPEIRIRSRESMDKRNEFLKEMGLKT